MIFPRLVAFRFLVIFFANKLIVQLFSHRRQSTKTTTATETNPITNLITNLIPNKLLQATRRSGDRQNLSPQLAETNREHTHTHTRRHFYQNLNEHKHFLLKLCRFPAWDFAPGGSHLGLCVPLLQGLWCVLCILCVYLLLLLLPSSLLQTHNQEIHSVSSSIKLSLGNRISLFETRCPLLHQHTPAHTHGHAHTHSHTPTHPHTHTHTHTHSQENTQLHR